MHAQAHKREISSLAQRHMNTPGVGARDHQLCVSLKQLYWVALGICVLVVPLTMTGIREYGIAIFLACSLAMSVAWATRQILFPSSTSGSLPAFIIACLAIGLVVLQLQPLPYSVLIKLSPFIPKFLPLWEPGSSALTGHAEWRQITMTPEATRSGLVLLIAYAMFFLTLTQHLQTQSDVDRLMKLVGISAVIMASIGIGQALFGNNKFLWMFEHPTRSANWPAKGTFHNQNHFAQFLALGLGPLVWWWYSLQPTSQSNDGRSKHRHRRSNKSRQRHRSRLELSPSNPAQPGVSRIVAAGTAIVGLAATLSFSRGGIAAFVLAALVVAAAVLNQWKTAIRYFVPTAVFVACALAAFGTDGLTRRWSQLQNATSLEDVDSARWTLWKADAAAVTEFWPAGSGVGSHADVYPIWMANHFGVRFSHAESGYIQVLLETGLPGFSLLITGMLFCVYWCIRGWRKSQGARRAQIAALSASLAASAAHSVVDFVWYIPACMILTLVAAACVCRHSQLLSETTQGSKKTHHPRLPILLACLLLLAALPTGQLFADTVQRDLASVDSWKAYRVGIRASVEDAEKGTTKTLNNHLNTLIRQLEECSAADPYHHDVHTALAPLYLQRFEDRLSNSDNQLTLHDIRDTVRDSDFATPEEMHAWLQKVCEDNVEDLYRARTSAMRGLQNRPLRGESYVILTETAFLSSYSIDDQQTLIQQAVCLRPNEPRVLFAAGLLAEDSGRPEAVWKMWKHAANLDQHIAQLIVRRNIDLLTATELIDHLSPTPDTFSIIDHEYRKAGRLDDLPTVAAMFADRYASRFSESLTGNSRQLSQYGRLFLDAKRSDLAVACFKQASHLQPKNNAIRRQLATALARTDDLRTAHQELSWLNLSMPNDQHIAQLLQDVEERMQSPNEPQNAAPHIRRVSHSQGTPGHQPEPVHSSDRWN